MMSHSDTPAILVPAEVHDAVVANHSVLFERIAGVDPHTYAADLLSEAKARQQAKILERYGKLDGARVLEIGAGLAMNLLVWSKQYGADVTGIEPDGIGFDASFKLGRMLMQANGLDPERIVNAPGEKLPFAEASFDIVYSANVLEHTDDPARVLREAFRVLRPGGVLQFVFPNYHSYYDGHYGVLHPPVFTRGFFPWYVKTIFRRDPAFARTLRTELNVGWVRRQVAQMQREIPIEVVGLGEDLFLERMTSLDFGTWATLGRVKRLLDLIGSPGVRRLLGRIIIGLRGWTPIVLTLRKPP